MRNSSLELLEKAHLPLDQARAILAAMEEEMTTREQALLTRSEFKEGLLQLEKSLQKEISEASLRTEMRLTETNRFILTCILGQTAVIGGAVWFAVTHLKG